MSHAPVVEARNLSKTYGRGRRPVAALRHADLRVDRGEIVGICGPSGSGKTTLLRLLSTMEAPTSGALHLGSAPVAGPGRGPAPKGFVMPVFQNPLASLDSRWPVWRTITEPLTAPHLGSKPGAAERRALARKWLDRIGLASVNADARPGALSGGQCQRISILRALAAQPRLVVADEPTSALDVSVAASVLHLLAETAASGVALIVVSHDEAALDALCDRIGRMEGGVLQW
ncbi:MAG: ABC transporter ATP-binding protein [Acidimicrobiia bacterium]